MIIQQNVADPSMGEARHSVDPGMNVVVVVAAAAAAALVSLRERCKGS